MEKERTALSKDACKIAGLIMISDTDERGLLFNLVARELEFNSQNYTAKLFRVMALEYGLPGGDKAPNI